MGFAACESAGVAIEQTISSPDDSAQEPIEIVWFCDGDVRRMIGEGYNDDECYGYRDYSLPARKQGCMRAVQQLAGTPVYEAITKQTPNTVDQFHQMLPDGPGQKQWPLRRGVFNFHGLSMADHVTRAGSDYVGIRARNNLGELHEIRLYADKIRTTTSPASSHERFCVEAAIGQLHVQNFFEVNELVGVLWTLVKAYC